MLQALKQKSRGGRTPRRPHAPTPPSVTAATPAAGDRRRPAETRCRAARRSPTPRGTGLARGPALLGGAGRPARRLRAPRDAGGELTPDGAVVASSILPVDPSPAPDPRFQQAYEAGRWPLPLLPLCRSAAREVRVQWRNIEVVFDPKEWSLVNWLRRRSCSPRRRPGIPGFFGGGGPGRSASRSPKG